MSDNQYSGEVTAILAALDRMRVDLLAEHDAAEGQTAKILLAYELVGVKRAISAVEWVAALGAVTA